MICEVAPTCIAQYQGVKVNKYLRGLLLRASFENEGVILQMFQWTYDSIAAECTRFIGPNGYGYVQVGPPTEHITGDSWWTDYQAVSYRIGSKHGNQAQFQHMIDTCHGAGVGIVVGRRFATL